MAKPNPVRYFNPGKTNRVSLTADNEHVSFAAGRVSEPVVLAVKHPVVAAALKAGEYREATRQEIENHVPSERPAPKPDPDVPPTEQNPAVAPATETDAPKGVVKSPAKTEEEKK